MRLGSRKPPDGTPHTPWRMASARRSLGSAIRRTLHAIGGMSTTSDGSHAVLLAGGLGTRLRPFTTSLPKPLVPIGDEMPVLEIVLRQLVRHGFRRATIAIGHLGDLIRAVAGDGSQWGLEVDYAPEDQPLGTIGPVVSVLDRLPEHFLVMNGDVLTD